MIMHADDASGGAQAQADKDLIAAQDGDRDALERLLERAAPLVRNELSIQEKWRSVLDADDVMQVTFMEAFVRCDRFVGNSFGAFVGWLQHIARHNLIDAIRELERHKRPQPERRLSFRPGSDASYVSLCALLGVTTTTPSRAAAAREVRMTVERALETLPPHYADAIRLMDLQGLGGEAAARQLGMNRSAAFMLRARARDRLREVLGSASHFFSDNS